MGVRGILHEIVIDSPWVLNEGPYASRPETWTPLFWAPLGCDAKDPVWRYEGQLAERVVKPYVIAAWLPGRAPVLQPTMSRMTAAIHDGTRARRPCGYDRSQPMGNNGAESGANAGRDLARPRCFSMVDAGGSAQPGPGTLSSARALRCAYRRIPFRCSSRADQLCLIQLSE